MPCILVVEGDRDTRDALRDVLEDDGHEVQIAADGETAIQQLTSDDPPGLILLDRWSRTMEPADFLEWLGKHPRFDRVRVIVATTDEGLRHRRVAQVLRKPFDLDDLLDAVREHCGH